jgi:hypothetical protein
MDWLISCITITSMELIARRKWYGWSLGLLNQGFWGYFMVYQKEAYGLLPICLVLTWRYSVAMLKWRREAGL